MFDKFLVFLKTFCNYSVVGIYECASNPITLEFEANIETNLQINILQEYLTNEMLVIDNPIEIYRLLAHTICNRVIIMPIYVLGRELYLLLGLSSSYNIEFLSDLDVYGKKITDFIIEHMQSELESQHMQYQSQQALIDPLTGLYNRLYLQKINIINYAYIAIFDIDNFKSINDSQGHQYGDEVIKFLGQLMKRHLEPNDIGIRYGGDEFIILFRSLNKKYIVDFTNDLSSNFYSKFNATISWGAVPVQENWDYSLELADKMLYKAKENGKGRLEI